jgi:hypothetical protein
MKVKVFRDMTNQIVAVIEIKEAPGVPPASILQIPGTTSSDIELTAEQSRMPLLDLHLKHAVEIKDGKPILVAHKIVKPFE